MRQGLAAAGYEVGGEIGRGRFGNVYRCSCIESGRCYALKSVDRSAISDPLDRELIEREPKLTQLVAGHPNVVGLHDVLEDERYVHLVLELCPGPDLFARIADAEAVASEPVAAAVVRQLMEALAHCHRKGVAHRDVKPDNVLFDGDGRLKLADFGSAGWFGDGRPMEGLVGTPYYVAPEIVEGKEYDEKVDVWSAGVILYVMLSGRPPFYGDTAMEIFQSVLTANLRFPTAHFRGVSSGAKDLLRRMLAKDVHRRFSAEQVLRHPWIVSMAGSEAPEDVASS